MLIDDRGSIARIAHKYNAISRNVLSFFVLLLLLLLLLLVVLVMVQIGIVRFVICLHVFLLAGGLLTAHVGQIAFDILVRLLLLLKMMLMLLNHAKVLRTGRRRT